MKIISNKIIVLVLLCMFSMHSYSFTKHIYSNDDLLNKKEIAEEPEDDTIIINSYKININDSIFSKDFKSQVNINQLLIQNTLLNKGDTFNIESIELERDRITYLLRQHGFWSLDKRYVYFTADTVGKKNTVDLELQIYPFQEINSENKILKIAHKQAYVDQVDIYIDCYPYLIDNLDAEIDTLKENGYNIYSLKDRHIEPRIILNNIYILPDRLYNEEWTKKHT